MNNIIKVLEQHPKYLKYFYPVHRSLMHVSGPLSYDYRCILAIMAAGRHKSCCLMNHYKKRFLQEQGNPAWMGGFDCLPVKFQNLNQINKLLAHRPWLVNKSHIESLVTGDDKWTLAELSQALVLLAYFHALSSFLFSCGINSETPEVEHNCNDTILIETFDTIRRGSSDDDNDTEVDVPVLVSRMLDISRSSSGSSINLSLSQEELTQRFEDVGRLVANIPGAPTRESPVVNMDINTFIVEPEFTYIDFAQRGRENYAPTFRFNEFSWTDKGCSLVNKLYVYVQGTEVYDGVGDMLEEKFKTAYELTYMNIAGRQNIETTLFRRAIWNYIHCLYGIRHDDYDYNEVNQLLNIQLKTFIKNSVCYPERVTLGIMRQAMAELTPSEKIHINILIMEGRLQGELLYATRTLSEYLANS